MPLQAPVRYTTGPTPSRAGRYPAPYVIINLSTSATIWVADNAGLQVGSGTPIFPGTSLKWTQGDPRDPAELWICADLPAEVLISYDVQDWSNPAAVAVAILNSGVLVIDDPQQLYLSIADVGPAQFPATPIDITRFQSLNLAIQLNAGAGTLHHLDVTFWSNGIPTYRFTLQFSVIGQQWVASIPAHGDAVSFNINSLSTFGILAVGSYRRVDTVQQRIQEVGNNQLSTNLALEFFAMAVGPSAVDFLLPPWYGQLQVDCVIENVTPATAPGSSNLSLFTANALGTYSRYRFQLFTPSATNATWTNSLILTLTGESALIRMSNSVAASSLAAVLKVTPINGNLI